MPLVALLLAGLSAYLLTTPHFMLAWLPAAALPLLWALLRRPGWGYWALVFLFPFGAVRDIGGIRLHWVLAAALLLLAALRIYQDRAATSRGRSNLWPFLAAYLLACVVATLFSPFPATAVGGLADLVLGLSFIYLSLFFVDHDSLRHGLPWVIAASIAVGSTLAALDAFFSIDPFGDADATQAKGLTISHNALAFMIVFAIPLSAHLMFHARSPAQRLAGLLLLAANLAGMVATYSRGGLLLTLFTLAMVVFTNRRYLTTRHVGLALLAAVLAPATIASVLPPDYFFHQMSMLEGKDDSIHRRQTYLYVAEDAFLDNPVLGSGPATFPEHYARSAYARLFEREGKSNERYAHNSYVEVAVGTGLVGLAAFLALLGRALRNFNHALRLVEQTGHHDIYSLIASYRLSYIAMLLYFFIKTALDNKYFLLILALSELSLRLARHLSEGGGDGRDA